MGMNDIRLTGMADLRADGRPSQAADLRADAGGLHLSADDRPSLPSFLVRPSGGTGGAAPKVAEPKRKGGLFRRRAKATPVAAPVVPSRQQATFDFVPPSTVKPGEVSLRTGAEASDMPPAIPGGEASPVLSAGPLSAQGDAPDMSAADAEPVTLRAPIGPVAREPQDQARRIEPAMPAAAPLPRLIVPNAPVTSPPKRPQPAPPMPVAVPRNGGKALVPLARRRRNAGVWMKRLAYGLVMLAGMVAVAAGVFTVKRLSAVPMELVEGEEPPSAIRLATARALAMIGMQVADVLVEGRDRVPAPQVLDALHVTHGEPILAYDAEAARLRLEALPWVETATVERRLPDTIYVRLTERQPFALWQHNGRYHLVDAKGSVIETQDIAQWARLPLVVGDGAPKAAEEFLLMLAAEPDIARRMKAAVRVGDRRWNLTLDGDIEVRLPEENPAVALGALADMERQGKLLEKDIRAIDLRIPDRMVVRLSPAAAERLRAVPAVNGQKNG
jgi:cell division protein FtsQ